MVAFFLYFSNSCSAFFFMASPMVSATGLDLGMASRLPGAEGIALEFFFTASFADFAGGCGVCFWSLTSIGDLCRCLVWGDWSWLIWLLRLLESFAENISSYLASSAGVGALILEILSWVASLCLSIEINSGPSWLRSTFSLKTSCICSWKSLMLSATHSFDASFWITRRSFTSMSWPILSLRACCCSMRSSMVSSSYWSSSSP